MGWSYSFSQSDGRRGRPGPGILHSSTQTPSPRRRLQRRRQSEATGPKPVAPNGLGSNRRVHADTPVIPLLLALKTADRGVAGRRPGCRLSSHGWFSVADGGERATCRPRRARCHRGPRAPRLSPLALPGQPPPDRGRGLLPGLQPQGRHHLAAAVLLGARLGASAPGHPGSPASSPGSGPRDTRPGPPTSSKRGRAPDRRPGGRRRAAGTPGRRTAQGEVAAARRACSLCAPPQNRTGLRCRNGEGRASWTDRGGTNESPFAQAPLGKCSESTPIATRVPRARTADVGGPNGWRPGALERRSVDVTRRPAGGGSI
jgi:hypothetical protein